MFHKMFTFQEDEEEYAYFFQNPPQFSINDAVGRLIADNYQNKKAIIKLIQEINAIHTAYREELCGCCCHEAVCSKKNSIKYGDECEDMEFPCICPVCETEESEDSQCCSKSGDGE